MALDHLAGRPSSNWKRLEVLLIVGAVLAMLQKSRNWQAKPIRFLDRLLGKYRPWQIVVATLLGNFVMNRFFLLLGLQAPEMFAKHYNRNFYRATWILTALDAGFWSAMDIRPAFLRHIMSLVFSIGYLFQADAADEKVRKLRSVCTVEMMRISWEKSTSPILWYLQAFNRPYLPYAKDIWLPRLTTPTYAHRFPNWSPTTRVKVFYDGSREELAHVRRIVLNLPGGGFVCMAPENHEDYLRKWAKQIGKDICIVSVDYKKAPEYPFPYALDECMDIYKSIVTTGGRCLGINTAPPTHPNDDGRIFVTLVGDSAGGNFVAAVMIKIIQENREFRKMNPQLFDEFGNLLDIANKKFLIDHPAGLLIIYGALSVDMACWIPPSHAPLLRPDSSTSLSGMMKNYKGRKYHSERSRSTEQVNSISPMITPVGSAESVNLADTNGGGYLALTSRMSYFSDRIITPELSRAMALLYLGQNSTVNPTTDMLVSPVIAPEDILAEFPPVWMMCGECDPFVDDTVVFAARIREAVAKRQAEEKQTASRNSTSSPPNFPRKGFHATLAMTTHADPAPTRFSIGDDEDDWEEEPTKTSSTTKEGTHEEYFDEADQYGEINQDPAAHVTVKIYAGLSHAYLNMSTFLPEATHATELCAQWLVDMFDSGAKSRARRKAKREAKRVQAEARKKRAEGVVVAEMRDEDNIPDTIPMATGAEYQALDPEEEKRRRPGPSPLALGEIEIYDDIRGDNVMSPLRDAMTLKKQSITDRLASSRAAAEQNLRRHNSASPPAVGPLEGAKTEKLAPPSASTPSSKQQPPKSTGTRPPAKSSPEKKGTSSSGSGGTSESDKLYVPEHKVFGKRQTAIEKHVRASGPAEREDSTTDEEDEEEARARARRVPMDQEEEARQADVQMDLQGAD